MKKNLIGIVLLACMASACHSDHSVPVEALSADTASGLSITSSDQQTYSASFAPADGKRKTHNVALGGKTFSAIELSCSADIEYVQGNKTSVTIVGLKEDVDKVCCDVNRGSLSITTQGKRQSMLGLDIRTSSFRGKVKVCIMSPKLTNVKIAGSGSFDAAGRVTTDALKLTIAGSGNIEMKDLRTREVSLNVSGSGDIDIDRLVASSILHANVSGSGEIDLDHVVGTCGGAVLNMAGSGEISAHFDRCDDLTASSVGSGEINVTGDVVRHSISKNGSGSVQLNNALRDNGRRVNAAARQNDANGINKRP